MQDVMNTAHSDYANAKPYPHIVLDNFFDPKLVDQILMEFPKPKAINWQKSDTDAEIKLASAAEASFGPMTRLFLYHLNSITFLEFLSRVTGKDNLISAPRFDGGGLDQIVRGGKLGCMRTSTSIADTDSTAGSICSCIEQGLEEEYGGHLSSKSSRCGRPHYRPR
jgi:hypothetical protein